MGDYCNFVWNMRGDRISLLHEIQKEGAVLHGTYHVRAKIVCGDKLFAWAP